eukprot:TRINITY_DN5406_c0_g1_i1.p1 TRINITY_DN5406_c0_g1~~TRINITY_DN5406_c0_g1_i1.p1  ORF type:complete len:621 (+),score=85.84 TRINITY_DN5406_c0_g1_i1:301-2163(+)
MYRLSGAYHARHRMGASHLNNAAHFMTWRAGRSAVQPATLIRRSSRQLPATARTFSLLVPRGGWLPLPRIFAPRPLVGARCWISSASADGSSSLQPERDHDSSKSSLLSKDHCHTSPKATPAIATDTSDELCRGCGSPIQHTNADGIGYRPTDRALGLGKKSTVGVVCQRCHRLKFYGEIPPHLQIPMEDADQHSLLSPIFANKRCLVVKLVDLFDFQGSFVPNFSTLAGSNPVVLVANKCDLLPKGVSFDRVRGWVRRMASEGRTGIRHIAKVHVVSAKSGFGLKSLLRDLDEMRKGRDVYFVGCTNVGKSSIINELTMLSRGKTKWKSGESMKRMRARLAPLTTSPIMGTTVDLVPLTMFRKLSRKEEKQQSVGVGKEKERWRAREDKRAQLQASSDGDDDTMPTRHYDADADADANVGDDGDEDDGEDVVDQNYNEHRTPGVGLAFDTPGIQNKFSITRSLTGEEQCAVMPSAQLRPKVYRLVEGKTLFLGGMGRLDYIEGPPLLFTVFTGSKVTQHATSISRADDVYEKQLGKMLTPPFDESVSREQAKAQKRATRLKRPNHGKNTDGDSSSKIGVEDDENDDVSLAAGDGIRPLLERFPPLVSCALDLEDRKSVV